jgi:glutamate/tyrosine decarboxylase-like PLP-dependent enzyme
MSNHHSSAASFAKALEQHLASLGQDEKLHLEGEGTHSLAAWFLGPKGENASLFEKLARRAIQVHARDRRTIYPSDPIWITEDIKKSPAYQESVAFLQTHFEKLLTALEGSVPFFSYRYQSHMLWDVAMPGLLGYFAGMLYNQNNVAAEASSVTTPLEMQVGNDLCRMLGFPMPKDPDAIQPWGHITADGSIANTESMWAARNLKHYPLALAAALKKDKLLKPARGVEIRLPNGKRGKLVSLTTWQLLNLCADDVLAMPTRLQNEYGIDPTYLGNVLENYSIQDLGFTAFERKYLKKSPPPALIGPGTMHYSWPKAAALLGLGKENLINIPLDLDARMEIGVLNAQLEACLRAQRPVIMVVAVLGSTEESAADPIDEILELRKKFRKRGLEFPIHVDAAWGGYFASVLRRTEHVPPFDETDAKHTRQYTPEMVMNSHVERQYKALPHVDSITIDPHKSGYQPYPAGALCYRNSAMRNLVSFTAPVVYHGGIDPTVGVYGIEGSKPGAAAAGVYLNHRVIRTDSSGYGKILGKCCFNSKRFYAALVTMARDDDDFIVVPMQRLPAERDRQSARKVHEQLEFIRKEIVPKSNDELLKDKKAMELFRELGPDLVITTYAFNFKVKDKINQDVAKVNQLNNNIFEALSLAPERDPVRARRMIVTSSSFDPAACGEAFLAHFMKRLGLRGKPEMPISFLVSTTMDPWLTDTADGNYIPTLIEALREVVMKEITSVLTQAAES